MVERITSNSSAPEFKGYVLWEDDKGNLIPLRSSFLKIRDEIIDTTDDLGRYTVDLNPYHGNSYISTGISTGIGDFSLDDMPVVLSVDNNLVFTVPLVSDDEEIYFDAPIADALSVGQYYAINFAGLSLEKAKLKNLVTLFSDSSGSSEYKPKENTLYIKYDNIYGPNVVGSPGFYQSKFNWDEILHEYGHHIASHLSLQSSEIEVEENDSKSHGLFENLIIEYKNLEVGAQIAWSEGLALYFAIAIPTVYKEDFIADSLTEIPPNVSLLPESAQGTIYSVNTNGKFFDIEHLNSAGGSFSADYAGSGEGNELSIARILWDLADGNRDSFNTGYIDEIHLGHRGLLQLLISSKALNPNIDIDSNLKELKSLNALWDGIESAESGSPQKLSKYGSIFEGNGVSPSPISEWLGTTLVEGAAPPPLLWEVGNFSPQSGEISKNDQFLIKIYDSNWQVVYGSLFLEESNQGKAWELVKGPNGEFIGSWSTGGLSALTPGEYFLVVQGGKANRTMYWSGAYSFSIGENTPPSLAKPLPDFQLKPAKEQEAFVYVIPSDTFYDPDVESGSDDLTITVRGLPNWLSFDGLTLSGVPTHLGRYEITVTAEDKLGATASDTFIVEVPNSAPTVLVPLANQTVTVNEPFSISLPASTFFDIDVEAGVDSLAYNVGGLEGASFNGSILSGMPTLPGETNISVTAFDESGGSVTSSFLLTVEENSKPLIEGTDADDRLYGNNDQDDSVIAKGGNDRIFTRGGDDIIDTGSGNNYVSAGSGDDIIKLGLGENTVSAGPGIDTVDFSNVGAEEYFVVANLVERNATLTSSSNPALVYTSSLRRVENLIGSTLDDILIGDRHGNLLNGGDGDDILTGGNDSDTFLFKIGTGFDQITDFNFTEDLIDITDFDFVSFEALQEAMTDVAGNVFINLNNIGDQVLIVGAQSTDLTFANFLF